MKTVLLDVTYGIVPLMTIPANKKLCLRLLALMEADQDMRTKAIEYPELWDEAMDKHHTLQLKEIIELYGWPTISLVGDEASHAAWLIAQHADHDLAFQEKSLALTKALPEDEVRLSNIAYLEDRVLRAQGRPQLYGTQFQGTGKDLKPQPIYNQSQLDQRRAKMGLSTFDEYVRLMQATYDVA